MNDVDIRRTSATAVLNHHGYNFGVKAAGHFCLEFSVYDRSGAAEVFDEGDGH